MRSTIAAIDLALARGVLYEALALGLSRPTGETLERLVGSGARLALPAAAAVMEAAGGGSAGLVPAVRRMLETPLEPLPMLQQRYDELFGHTARGRVCPFETEYGAMGVLQQPQELADIAGCYAAFGLRATARAGIRVDHMACECEFMAFLCRKEAVWLDPPAGGRGTGAAAPARLDHETLEETRKAGRQFLRAHLARFGLAFATRLAGEDSGGLHGRLGELLSQLLQVDCRRLGVPRGRDALDLRPAGADDVPMACGTGDELVQIQGLRSQVGR